MDEFDCNSVPTRRISTDVPAAGVLDVGVAVDVGSVVGRVHVPHETGHTLDTTLEAQPSEATIEGHLDASVQPEVAVVVADVSTPGVVVSGAAVLLLVVSIGGTAAVVVAAAIGDDDCVEAAVVVELPEAPAADVCVAMVCGVVVLSTASSGVIEDAAVTLQTPQASGHATATEANEHPVVATSEAQRDASTHTGDGVGTTVGAVVVDPLAGRVTRMAVAEALSVAAVTDVVDGMSVLVAESVVSMDVVAPHPPHVAGHVTATTRDPQP